MVKNVNLRIRELREDRDLTQQYVANILMCDQSLYSKYERGERELPLRMAVRLATFYNVSIDYIVGMSEEKSPVRTI
jgi:transcriptional regulator with XRE-family HTH domain